MKLSELSNPRKLLMLVAGCTSDCDALTGCSSWVFNCAFDTPAARNAEKPRIRSDFIAIPLLDSCLMIKKNAMIVKPLWCLRPNPMYLDHHKGDISTEFYPLTFLLSYNMSQIHPNLSS